MNYTVQARITPEIFQEFAWFDLLRQQRRWRAPLLFAGIMAVFACICFLAASRVRGAALLGGVLLGVGIVLPLGWLLSFYLSLRAEAKKRRLTQAPAAYTLRLTDQGLGVSNETEQANFSWSQLHRVCRLRRCICLYAAPHKAFLLPTEGGDEADHLWQDICCQVPGEKVRDYSR